MDNLLSSVNVVIVRAVLRAGHQMSMSDLLAHVTDVLGVEPTVNAFGRRLRWLRDCGWLIKASAATQTGVWRLTPAAVGWLATHGDKWPPARLDGALPPRDHTEPAAPAPAPRRAAPTTGPVVPPPQFDRMHGPVLRQGAWQPARAGALDHLRCPSRGIDSGHPARPVHPTGDPR